jgi:hypothetical protein
VAPFLLGSVVSPRIPTLPRQLLLQTPPAKRRVCRPDQGGGCRPETGHALQKISIVGGWPPHYESDQQKTDPMLMATEVSACNEERKK